MINIRFQRRGRKKRPFFRLVLADQRAKRDGGVIKDLGYLNPISKELKVAIEDSIVHLGYGAKLSHPVTNLFVRLQLVKSVNLISGGAT